MMPHQRCCSYHHHHQVMWQACNMTQLQRPMAQCHGPPPSPPGDVVGPQHDTATTPHVHCLISLNDAFDALFELWYFYFILFFISFYFILLTNLFSMYVLMTVAVNRCPYNTTFTPTTTIQWYIWQACNMTWWQWPHRHRLISPNNALFGLWYVFFCCISFYFILLINMLFRPQVCSLFFV